MSLVLAGDTGGTKTHLAYFSAEGTALTRVHDATFASREHRSLEEIVERFVADRGLAATVACFGVAGPVVDGVGHTTNLPWVVDARALRQRLGIAAVDVINDLEANAWGIAALGPSDLEPLQAGAPGAGGNAVVVSAGTGLGVAGLFWDGAVHRPFATEGGHADFAPRDRLEDEFLGWLRRDLEHVSYERIASGPGLHNAYRFLRDSGRGVEEEWLSARLAREDPPAVIGGAAVAGTSPLCAAAVHLFLAMYGAVAGNVALTLMATGGVYLGGGIAPKLLALLRGPAFLGGFNGKGRMRPLLERMAVRVVLNDRTALIGAARYALARAGTR
jgi:glucokinase